MILEHGYLVPENSIDRTMLMCIAKQACPSLKVTLDAGKTWIENHLISVSYKQEFLREQPGGDFTDNVEFVLGVTYWLDIPGETFFGRPADTMVYFPLKIRIDSARSEFGEITVDYGEPKAKPEFSLFSRTLPAMVITTSGTVFGYPSPIMAIWDNSKKESHPMD